jgi:hypothetical protein
MYLSDTFGTIDPEDSGWADVLTVVRKKKHSFLVALASCSFPPYHPSRARACAGTRFLTSAQELTGGNTLFSRARVMKLCRGKSQSLSPRPAPLVLPKGDATLGLNGPQAA